MVVFQDAKDFFKEAQFEAHPTIKLICLSTIKRLIAKDFGQKSSLPILATGDEAIAWVTNATNKAIAQIDKLKIKRLAKLECQVVMATIAMERQGLFFNKSQWQSTLDEISQENQSLKMKLLGLLKREDGFSLFGPATIDLSHQGDVKAALEGVLKRKLSGISQSSLEEIDHEAARLLLRYRENSRILSTYGENFMARVVDDRLHGNYVPIGSASGRFACCDPNLLALPNSQLFQACLTPRPPRKLIRFDYGGFELRILASMSKDQALMEIFNNHLDIHSTVAEAIFHTQVSKTHNAHLRERAKLLNFGIIYGMGEHALAKQLKIPLSEANTMLKSYFQKFSNVYNLLKSLETKAKARGYGQTALRRRAYFSSNDQGYLTRIARNMPIQGTGADIVKLAMCLVYKELYYSLPSAHLVNLVHDELVVECDHHDVDQVTDLVKRQMETAFVSILPDVLPEVSVK